jgi:hypothetical protein
METFVQDFGTPIHSMNAGTLVNCMTCHTGISNISLAGIPHNGSSSPLYFSHIFRSYLSNSSGVAIKDVQLLRVKEFMQTVDKQANAMKK